MRGVERTLSVLRALNELNGSSVTLLACRTSISRPALYRILETLIAQGYVRRRMEENWYELTSKIRLLSDGYRDSDWVREVALPLINELQREIVWPTDLATFSDNAMYLRETTRRCSPLTIDGLTVGLRLPMLHTATGRAFLAYCDNAERQIIIENLMRSGRAEDAKAKDEKFIESMISVTRKRGYAEREEEIFPKTSAIALPIHSSGRILACINITFIASVLKPKDAADRYLAALSDVAKAIGRRVDSYRREYDGLTPSGKNGRWAAK